MNYSFDDFWKFYYEEYVASIPLIKLHVAYKLTYIIYLILVYVYFYA